MAVKYVKPSATNHPLKLSDHAIERITAVLEDRLDPHWVSSEEYEAFQDLLYDRIAADKQTVEGVLTLQ